MRQVFKRVPDHPLLAGLEAENLRDWRGEATLLPPRLKYEMRPGYGPTVRWCGIPVTRVWRCGNRGNVASVLIEKPARGDFLPILDGGFSLQYSPLMEYREGRGMVAVLPDGRLRPHQSDPAAERLARNIVEYASLWKAGPCRRALYLGEPAGKSYLERAGVPVASYEGGELSADQVLVVGSGGKNLSAAAAPTARWLGSGGHLLAIGLDEKEARALLSFKVSMKKAEHISTGFEPFGTNSPLAGVGPADVHNRDPREVWLVSGGAAIIGNGVLATAEKAHVVFFQLAPWTFDYGKQYHLKCTFRRTSFVVARLLAGMGINSPTPLLARFSNPLVSGKLETRWLEGLYLDRPEEWDDPYRFFRW